jgi:hypothetical protein
MKLIKKRLGYGLPDLSSLVHRLAADLALDAVQCAIQASSTERRIQSRRSGPHAYAFVARERSHDAVPCADLSKEDLGPAQGWG